MEQISSELLNAFGKNVKVVNNIQRFATYICKLDDKEICIKKFRGSEKDVTFVHNIKQKLKSKGFTNLDIEILTLEGEPFFVYNEDIYICHRNVVGERINFTDTTNVLFLMAELGRLHKALVGTNIKDGNVSNITFKSQYEQFQKLKKQVSKYNKKTDVDFNFLKTYNKYEGQITKILKDLEFLDFDNYENTAIMLSDIYFGSYEDNNFIIEKNNLTFYDFGRAKCGVQLNDVVGVIYAYVKACHKEGVKPVDINILVDSYKRNNELTSRELLILQALLSFPQKYLNSIFNYYEKKRNFVPTETIVKLQKYAEIEEVYYDYIYDLEV